LRVLAGTRPDADTGLIRRAYDVAADRHQGQQRNSGEPYVTHPLAVATVIAELGADDQTLCAALLHDTLEGTSHALAALRADFGAEIAGLVAGVTALDDPPRDQMALSRAGPPSAAAASGDARILVIKLADRLHNMRTLRHLPPPVQVRTSRQTLEILVPLARRLRLNAIKSELESLAGDALKRHGPTAATMSGRLLAAMTALLPAVTRARWREEWLGELSVLPTRRERVIFAAQTLLGTARLAATLYRPGHRKQAHGD
jgi:GTP diphosphokinase / guanosine-3',5'-bis(diphosphate) 3'-diphosphatase